MAVVPRKTKTAPSTVLRSYSRASSTGKRVVAIVAKPIGSMRVASARSRTASTFRRRRGRAERRSARTRSASSMPERIATPRASALKSSGMRSRSIGLAACASRTRDRARPATRRASPTTPCTRRGTPSPPSLGGARRGPMRSRPSPTTSVGRWSIITTTGFGPRSARPWRRSATGPILTRDIRWRRQVGADPAAA